MVLPKILSTLTGKKRYKPDIVWSDKSWVHNIFRVYELIFWRKVGIRAEMRSGFDGEKVEYEVYSFEAWCAFIETYIRSTLKFKPIKLHKIRLATNPYGYSVPMASFAIALDSANDDGTGGTGGVSTSPDTWSHTCTGSNLFLVVGAGISTGFTTPTSIGTVSYNSVNMTQAAEVQDNVTFATDNGIYFLGGPASGSNTVSVAFSGGSGPTAYAGAVSYTGAQSGSTADAHNTSTGTGTGDKTISVTTVASNCWIFCNVVQTGNTGSITADQTQRFASSSNINQSHIGGEDTNAAQTAGSHTMGWTIGTLGTNWSLTIASFAPAGATTLNINVSDTSTTSENLPTPQIIYGVDVEPGSIYNNLTGVQIV